MPIALNDFCSGWRYTWLFFALTLSLVLSGCVSPPSVERRVDVSEGCSRDTSRPRGLLSGASSIVYKLGGLYSSWDDVEFRFDDEEATSIRGWPAWFYVDSAPSLLVGRDYFKSVINPDKYRLPPKPSGELTTTRPLELYDQTKLPTGVTYVDLSGGLEDICGGTLSLGGLAGEACSWKAKMGTVFEPRTGDFDLGVGRVAGERPYYVHLSNRAFSGEGEGLSDTGVVELPAVIGYTSESGKTFVIIVLSTTQWLRGARSARSAAAFVVDTVEYAEKGLHAAIGKRSELVDWSSRRKDMLIGHGFQYYDENGELDDN